MPLFLRRLPINLMQRSQFRRHYSSMAKKTAEMLYVASDTPPNASSFAEELFSLADENVEPVTPEAGSLNLERLIEELHDCGTNVGLQSLGDCGLRVWIGDPLNGVVASASIGPDDAGWEQSGAVALWLHDAVLRYLPNSAYARRHGATGSLSASNPNGKTDEP
jgi:hypothetical protein